MRVLSGQEFTIMGLLKNGGAMNLAQLQSALPPDGRTLPVRNASISRSLRRLRQRGLIDAANHMFFRPDIPRAVKVRPANSVDAMRAKAMAILRRNVPC